MLLITGKLSAKDVQDLAALAVASGATDREVVWLASLGSHGAAIGGNISKQIYNAYCKHRGLCDPEIVAVKCKDVKTSKTIEAQVAMFLPHDLLSSLSHNCPTAFASLFGARRLPDWWKTIGLNNSKFWQHPILDGNLESCIPIQMFGDGVEFQDRDSLTTIGLKGVCMEESGAKDSYMLIAAFPKCATIDETWQDIWRWNCWSLQALLTGKHPRQDPFGVDFPLGSKRHALAGSDIIRGGFTSVLWAFAQTSSSSRVICFNRIIQKLSSVGAAVATAATSRGRILVQMRNGESAF